MCLSAEIAIPLCCASQGESTIHFHFFLSAVDKKVKITHKSVKETFIITLYKPFLTLQGDVTKALIDFFTVNTV